MSKLLFTIFTFLPFYLLNSSLQTPKSMLHWAEDPPAVQNPAAKSLSWSAPKLEWDNNQFPEVRKDGYDVSDIRHYSIWCACRRPTYAPE